MLRQRARGTSNHPDPTTIRVHAAPRARSSGSTIPASWSAARSTGRLCAPDGTQLAADWFGDSPGRQVTLPATGQYTVRVNDYYYGYYGYYGTATGTYSFTLTAVPPAQISAIALGTTVSNGAPAAGAGNIEAPGSDDEYAFSGTAGQTIRLNDLEVLPCCSLYWRLFVPDGTQLGADWLGNSTGAQFTLPTTGQYTVRVNDYSARHCNRHLLVLVDRGAARRSRGHGADRDLPQLRPERGVDGRHPEQVGRCLSTTCPRRSTPARTARRRSDSTGRPCPDVVPARATPKCAPLPTFPPSRRDSSRRSWNTDGLSSGDTVAGDVSVSADGVDDATGLLDTVTIATCGVACVLAVAAPGVAVASSAGPPTAALPTKQVLALPCHVAAGHTGHAPVDHAEPERIRGRPEVVPHAAGQTHCTGQISAITAQFAKYTDPAHPIRVSVVAHWGSTTPTGRILMEKDAGGDPLFLVPCSLNSTTHQYNTPCVLPETRTGSTAAGNLITTNVVLFIGPDIHFARRTATGGTVINPPGAPTAVTAVPGSLQATVKWKAPTATNGAAVSGYVVSVFSGGALVKKVTFASPNLTQTITGLTNGKAYTFKVAAQNVSGTGVDSVASPATAVGGPAAPTGIGATRVAAGSLRVTYTAPANNGAAITSYTATCTSTNLGVTKTKTASSGALTVTGLTAGKTYKCTVKATNSRGTGPASVASAAVVA